MKEKFLLLENAQKEQYTNTAKEDLQAQNRALGKISFINFSD
jgi:hypothetical protein